MYGSCHRSSGITPRYATAAALTIAPIAASSSSRQRRITGAPRCSVQPCTVPAPSHSSSSSPPPPSSSPPRSPASRSPAPRAPRPPASPSGAAAVASRAANRLTEDLRHIEVHRPLELGVAARLRLAVRPPAHELRRVAEARALHVVVADLEHALGPQRDERQRLARVPAAPERRRRAGRARAPSSTGAPRTSRPAAAAPRTARAAAPSGTRRRRRPSAARPRSTPAPDTSRRRRARASASRSRPAPTCGPGSRRARSRRSARA